MVNKIQVIDELIEKTNKQIFINDINQKFFIRILTDSDTKNKQNVENRIGELQRDNKENNKYIDYLEEIRGEIMEEQRKGGKEEV